MTAGVILAGGRSSRMGTPKAFLQLGDRPLIAHVAQRLRAVCDRLIVVSHERETARAIGAELLLEDPPHQGPLQALAQALGASGGVTLVSGCDSPLLSVPLLEVLVAKGESGAVCVVDDRPQPIPAAYGSRCGPVAQALVQRGIDRLTGLLYAVDAARVEPSEWRLYDPHGLSFLACNTASDFADVQRAYAAHC